jgi:NADH-quinone oxidoreductase subunit D
MKLASKRGLAGANHAPENKKGTRWMELNMGPQHPSTHGVIRLVLQTDGEHVFQTRPDVGYLHRGIEKIAEQCSYVAFSPYADRVDYLSAMNAETGYALTVEKAAGIEIPERAEYIRVIVQELNRIASHIIALGTYSLDMGGFTPFVYLLRERETINDILEGLCGARLTYHFVRIGGVSRDIDATLADRIAEFLDHFDRIIPEFNRLITFNEIFVRRLACVGVINGASALHHGLVGPNLRASGIGFDVRRAMPYGFYDRMEFDVPVGQGWRGVRGDAFDRFYCRVLEMQQSSRIIRQCLAQMSPGEIRAKIPRRLTLPAGEHTGRVEAPRGCMTYLIVSDGADRPYRLHVRTGSFQAMTVLEPMGKNMLIADLISFFASLDVVAPEIDR